MCHTLNEALAKERTADLHREAMARRLRPDHDRGCWSASLRVAVGRRLVVLGWRLLDGGLEQAHRVVR